MTLEVERITDEVNSMARVAAERQETQRYLVDMALRKLKEHANDWELISGRLEQARNLVDIKRLRAAHPLSSREALDAVVDPPSPPLKATLIGVDGSQIYPDRHHAFLYSLVNIGVFVFYHGQRGIAPTQYTIPFLDYPGRPGSGRTQFVDSHLAVGMRRDRGEIEALAKALVELQDAAKPILAVMDQRLLYWPAVGAGGGESDRVLHNWQVAMTEIRKSGGLLTGYIANPGKSSVITMLNALDIDEPGFDLEVLRVGGDLLPVNDAMLFQQILGPGQRSTVFVDVSQHNDAFAARDPENEVCFFYLNPGRSGGQIARIDMPISAAREPEVVATVHALIYDQCQILGDYPYLLARADEVAVISRRDQEQLDSLIERRMENQGLQGQTSAKLGAKEIARAGKLRHEL